MDRSVTGGSQGAEIRIWTDDVDTNVIAGLLISGSAGELILIFELDFNTAPNNAEMGNTTDFETGALHVRPRFAVGTTTPFAATWNVKLRAGIAHRLTFDDGDRIGLVALAAHGRQGRLGWYDMLTICQRVRCVPVVAINQGWGHDAVLVGYWVIISGGLAGFASHKTWIATVFRRLVFGVRLRVNCGTGHARAEAHQNDNQI